MTSTAPHAMAAGLPQGHFIAGSWDVPAGGRVFEVFDPSTASVACALPVGSAADVARAVESSWEAFATWRALAPAERERLLHRLADTMEAAADRLADLEALNCGKPRAAAAGEVEAAIELFRFYAGYPTKVFGQQVTTGDPEMLAYTVREPLGVIGAIAPWNYPLLIAAGKVAAALAAGCTVVVKPAPETPLTTLELARLAAEAGLPAGALNVVVGGDETGAALTRSPHLKKLAFTGSTHTARLVLAELAATLRPAVMELGGKSPNIVFDDVDLPATVESVLMGALYNAGQECCAGARVLVQQSIYDDFLDLAAQQVPKIVVGPGSDPATQIGPLISESQWKRVDGFVQRAIAEGARMLVQGPVPDRGFFYQPTVLVDVHAGMEVCREEVFGPVLTVDRFDTDEAALQMANDTRYGLAAGVWTTDIGRALRFARELAAGQIWINSYLAGDAAMPFGGGRDSGFGRELGYEGLLEYTETKSVYLRAAPGDGS